jgi:molybdopterin converting factor small subunit
MKRKFLTNHTNITNNTNRRNDMSVTIQVPTALRSFTEGKREVQVEGATVKAALADLAAKYPDIRQHLFDDAGEVRSFVNIFLGEDNVKSLSGLDTALADGAALMLVPAIAGGVSSQYFARRARRHKVEYCF